MKRFISVITLLCLAFGCTSNTAGIASYPQPAMPAPSTNSTSSPDSLNNLKVGILPDNPLSPEEQKVSNLLSRKVKIDFPLKLGVLLYKSNLNTPNNSRRDLYNNFLNKLKANPNIFQVVEIPAGLIGNATDIEEIRKLAARFQITTLLIVNDFYDTVYEKKDGLTIPADVITDNRNWETFASIEILALDILNGVFITSENVNVKKGDKYVRSLDYALKEDALLKQVSTEAWDQITQKVINKIEAVKNQMQQPQDTSNK